MGLMDTLKRLDGHSSVSNEFRVHTFQGAILSLFTLSIISYLVISEYHYNFTIDVVEKVHVHTTTSSSSLSSSSSSSSSNKRQELDIEFDLSLWKVPCAIVSIDSNDPTGQRQSLHLDTNHHIWKHRLDKTGEFIGQGETLELGSSLLDEEHLLTSLKNVSTTNAANMTAAATATAAADGMSPHEEIDTGRGLAHDHHITLKDIHMREEECLSCYGAGDEGECCNTCDDVKRAYVRKGWHIHNITEIVQCASLVSSKDEQDEGCNVHGKISLSTGGGSLYIVPNRALETYGSKQGMLSIMDAFLNTFESFNVSHTIHRMRFGKAYPGHIHQLDGEARHLQDSYGMYQYYIQIVPTTYKYLDGHVVETNQYSVTEHMRHVNPGSGRGLPGVFFFYEVSPYKVVIEEYQRGWVAFFTSVAAIVGGVVTVMGMVDQYLHHAGSPGRHDTTLLR